MFCENCGNQVVENAKFCGNCGHSLVESEAVVEPKPEPKPIPAVVVEPKPEPKPTPVVDPKSIPMPEPVVEQVGVPVEHPVSKKKNIGIISAVLVICVGVLTCFYLYKSGIIGSGTEIAEETNLNIDQLLETEEEDQFEQSEEQQDEQIATENQENSDNVPVEDEEKEEIFIEILQVDNQQFPDVKVYVSFWDQDGAGIMTLKHEDILLEEELVNGMISTTRITGMEALQDEDSIAVNAVVNISESMEVDGKLERTKEAIHNFLSFMGNNDRMELTTFSDFVYVTQSFTSDQVALSEALEVMTHSSGTALYDAIYSAILQTYAQNGAKYVIVFTDGVDDSSNYSDTDVVNLSKNTGIPVYIVGLGMGSESEVLKNMATMCMGDYYGIADYNTLSVDLKQLGDSIFTKDKDQFVLTYTSTNLDNQNEFRNITIKIDDTALYEGVGQKSYIPVSDVVGVFQADYASLDYICPDSNVRLLTDDDLAGLSLAELRIARNEIYARYGRQFLDPLLNQWFYSKMWYLTLNIKYSPTEFSAINPQPLSELENDNAELIKVYEQHLLETQEIYPNASMTVLSEYDLALTKDLLELALEQLNEKVSTNILEENKALISETINRMSN